MKPYNGQNCSLSTRILVHFPGVNDGECSGKYSYVGEYVQILNHNDSTLEYSENKWKLTEKIPRNAKSYPIRYDDVKGNLHFLIYDLQKKS